MSLSALRQQLAAILPPPRAGDAAAIEGLMDEFRSELERLHAYLDDES